MDLLTRTGIGCEYVNVDGQLTHPLLLNPMQILKDGAIGYERWLEIPAEDANRIPSHTGYFADHDLSEINTLETILQFEEEDLEAVVISIFTHFPFPKIGGIDVLAYAGGPKDAYLMKSDPLDNLEHYSWHMIESNMED